MPILSRIGVSNRINYISKVSLQKTIRVTTKCYYMSRLNQLHFFTQKFNIIYI